MPSQLKVRGLFQILVLTACASFGHPRIAAAFLYKRMSMGDALPRSAPNVLMDWFVVFGLYLICVVVFAALLARFEKNQEARFKILVSSARWGLLAALPSIVANIVFYFRPDIAVVAMVLSLGAIFALLPALTLYARVAFIATFAASLFTRLKEAHLPLRSIVLLAFIPIAVGVTPVDRAAYRALNRIVADPSANAKPDLALDLDEKNAVTVTPSAQTAQPHYAERPPTEKNVELRSATWIELPDETEPVDHPIRSTKECVFPNLDLPASAKIFAAGAYEGRALTKQIDRSGHSATQFDIVVNSKDPVALLLAAYEPSIWNIGWTQDTRIVAVIVSGYYRQVVAGLPRNVPILIGTSETNNVCGAFRVSDTYEPKLDGAARKAFGRPVDSVFTATNGSMTVGSPTLDGALIYTSESSRPDSYFDEKAPLAGRAGLAEAEKNGLIRKSSEAEILLVKNTLVAEGKASVMARIRTSDTYTVLENFIYPSGLFGANAATFIILKGGPMPEGSPGHSVVWDLNRKPLCTDPQCH